MLTEKRLFDEEAPRTTESMINASTTNLREWNRAKYDWSYKLYRTMLNNFWIPEEVPLATDQKQYELLDEFERRAVDKTIAFLNFLDSQQCENLPHLANYVTAPEVVSLLNVQTFQEEIHAQSYSYVIDTICSKKHVEEIYDEWRNDAILKQRIKFISDTYQKFVDDTNPTTFVISVFADFLLESLYFYSGFMLFHSLARQGKLTQTDTIIKYIQRDELTHVVLFANMFKELRKELPEVFTEELINDLNEMMITAVENEIAWGHYVTDNRINGISNELITEYIRYTSNERMKMLGLPILYPENTQHPLKWIESYADMNGIKTDFFEQKVTNYSKASSLDFDDL